jgi:hypothetical protein
LRILLDECLPRRLKRSFRSYGLVLTVADAGLSSYTNGQLFRRISGDFDVFVTIDKSIEHQQNLALYDVASAAFCPLGRDRAAEVAHDRMNVRPTDRRNR